MAEILVSVIAEEILRKAFSFASSEISLVWGFKDETQRLGKKMQMIQALLADAENKHLFKRTAVSLWTERLKDIALDADNVLDELVYEEVRNKLDVKVSKRNKVRNFFSSSNPVAFHRKMASKIKNINLSLDELNREANEIGLIETEFVSSRVEFSEIMQTGPFVDDADIVGRNEDISSIVSWLVNSKDEKELPVVSIVGMPGQGKTTVAQLVYKNEEIVKHFDHKLWICVSDDFSVDRLLNEMIEAVTYSRSDMMNREAMVKKLRGTLSNKRYLLVLDDVWNENQVKWDLMNGCLLEIGGSSGSKIMVTTRSEGVCLTMHTCMTHHLNTLSGEESWSLFKQVAFADGGAIETTELVSIGKRILRKCGGVPLAVKALAGALYARKGEREWLAIEKNELWSSSVGEGTVLPCLRLSYNHLQFLSLKQCFAYCSLFQKDSVMDKDKLIQLWIAQGFLNGSKDQDMEMEDIGTNYINILLRNSLLQVDKRDDCGNVRTCKMHDLVHDLALDVSKTYCLATSDEEVNDEIKVVNLSLKSGERTLTEMSDENSRRLRTLFCSGDLLGDLFIKFKKLRVLILNSDNDLEFPSSIGRLKHLRFIDVSETKILRLPDSLTKLYNLQTLRLHGLEDLPKDFMKLINLRHFYVENCENSNYDVTRCLLPGIGELTCLRSLPYFIVSHDEGCQISELQDLNNLRGALKIYGLGTIRDGVEAMEANVKGKPHIDTLEYHWSTRAKVEYVDEVNDEDVLEGMIPHSNVRGIKLCGYNGRRFPSWIQGPNCSHLLRNLVKIILEDCDICTLVPPLGCLPCLKIACINMNEVSSIGYEFYGLDYLDSAISNTPNQVSVFPALRKLTLQFMSRLEEWLGIEESDSEERSLLGVKEFPQLEELIILACEELTYVRDLGKLTSLRVLTISSCTNLDCLPLDLGLLENLEQIRIIRCNSLVFFPDIHGLRCLRKLSFEYCRKLAIMPEGLQSLKLLQQIRLSDLPNLVDFPNAQGLQSLRWLVIERCPKLNALPRGLEFCTSLYYVIIGKCSVLLLDGLHYLPSLRRLVLGPFSDDLSCFPWYCTTPTGHKYSEAGNDGFKGHFLSLQEVSLYGWPKLTSLPQQLQFYSLTLLYIFDFNGLVALPEWLSNIKSLQSFNVFRCDNLMYFPSADAMKSLKNLQKLVVDCCPLLGERCAPGTGPEWHKIAHIPEISINAKPKLKNW